ETVRRVTAVQDVHGAGLEHEAFVYGSDADYVGTLAPLLADAVAAGEVVFGVVPSRNAALLRDELGADAARVQWVDAQEWYRQPARTIAGYDGILRSLRPGATAFVVGEVQFGRTEAEWRAWTRYESALNRVLARYPARVVCPYDERTLPSSVVRDAECTHPHLLTQGPSERYVEPERLLAMLTAQVRLPRHRPEVELFQETSVRAGRRAFAAAARAWGLPEERVQELTVGISEVLTNALVHGGGWASIRIWTGDDALTCAVEDNGDGSDDSLIGLRPPPPDAEGGYGLWYARQVFDSAEVVPGSTDGGLLVVLVARRA
ncbi:MAG TPA: sensor histidine kinase, partial [Acidimicrobiales bacterium]|nr:sensor histidine kinase [Acidimicrobiales bacterium]